MRKEMALLIIVVFLFIFIGIFVAFSNKVIHEPVMVPEEIVEKIETPNIPPLPKNEVVVNSDPTKTRPPLLIEGNVYSDMIDYFEPVRADIVRNAKDKGYKIKEFSSDATCDGKPIDFSMGCPSGMIKPPSYTFFNLDSTSESQKELVWKQSEKHIAVNRDNIILYYRTDEFYFTFTCPELNSEDCHLRIIVSEGISESYVINMVLNEIKNIGLVPGNVAVVLDFV